MSSRTFNKLMIVAHPDDDILWGGGNIIAERGWKVIGATNQNNKERSKEFFDVMRAAIVDEYKLFNVKDRWSYNIDLFLGTLFEKELERLSKQKWKLVLTHNADGEYGHPQHQIVHQLVNKHFKSKGHNVKYFNVSSKKLPDDIINKKKSLLRLYTSQQTLIRRMTGQDPIPKGHPINFMAGIAHFLYEPLYVKLKEPPKKLPKLKIKKMWRRKQTDPRLIISLSVFGNDPLFTRGAVNNVKVARLVYPGWTVRIYVDKTVPKKDIDDMLNEGAQVYFVESGITEGLARTLWRFLPAGEPVKMISRDADSRVNSKEAWAISEWCKSGKKYHTMWDNSSVEDGHFNPMLGGMWGTSATCKETGKPISCVPFSKEKCKAIPAVPGIAELIMKWVHDPINKNIRGIDEKFLRFNLFPDTVNDFKTHGRGIDPVKGEPFRYELRGRGQHVGVRIDIGSKQDKEKNWKKYFVDVIDKRLKTFADSPKQTPPFVP